MEYIAWTLGWWLPAVGFYLLGIYSIVLIFIRRDWKPIAMWVGVFALMQGYILWNGIAVQDDFKSRAARFQTMAVYSPPPAEVRTIVIAEDDERPRYLRRDRFKDRPPGLTGYSRNCAVVCVQLLFSGRFDRVVVRRTNDDFLIYQVVAQPGCRSFDGAPLYLQDYLRLWQNAGRCVTEQRASKPAGARFEVFTDGDAADARSWQEHVTDIRLAGTDHDGAIARAENGAATFAVVMLPWPGLFPWNATGSSTHVMMGVPRSAFQHYGPDLTATKVLEQLFGLTLPRSQYDLPKPPI